MWYPLLGFPSTYPHVCKPAKRYTYNFKNLYKINKQKQQLQDIVNFWSKSKQELEEGRPATYSTHPYLWPRNWLHRQEVYRNHGGGCLLVADSQTYSQWALFFSWFLLLLFVCFLIVHFLRQGLTRLTWKNSLCRLVWPQIYRSTCLCLLSAVIKGEWHHVQLQQAFPWDGTTNSVG